VPLSTDKTSYPPTQACATLSAIFTSGVVFLVDLVCFVYLVDMVCLVSFVQPKTKQTK